MDIAARLKLFMDLNKITNSQFADACAIPRPSVSQLLNGRNKKVSDEVISKIHASYPSLSILWLMFGEEPMMLDGAASGNAPNVPNANSALPQAKPRESSLFDDELDGYAENATGGDAATRKKQQGASGNKASDGHWSGGSGSGGAAISQALENLARSVGDSGLATRDTLQGTGRKKIVNVMVFYSDNSFESFVPDK